MLINLSYILFNTYCPDVYHTGVVVVVVCALIALTTAILTLLILAPRSTLSTRSLPLQAWALLICSLWLFAALVPFTMYVAQHEAQITATLDGLPLPPAVVQGVEKALGVTSVYKDIPYCAYSVNWVNTRRKLMAFNAMSVRLVAILPWFTFLFTSFAAAISFVAIRRINNNSSHHNAIRDDLHEKTNPTA